MRFNVTVYTRWSTWLKFSFQMCFSISNSNFVLITIRTIQNKGVAFESFYFGVANVNIRKQCRTDLRCQLKMYRWRSSAINRITKDLNSIFHHKPSHLSHAYIKYYHMIDKVYTTLIHISFVQNLWVIISQSHEHEISRANIKHSKLNKYSRSPIYNNGRSFS